ncbi:transposase, partial [Primorskyibacter flagellatus]
MKRTRYSEEQIIGILTEHEAGAKCADLCRKHGMSEGTFYAWKAKFSGMTVSDAKRLKTLEDENAKLKKLLAEQMLDAAAMKKMLKKAKPAELAGLEESASSLELVAGVGFEPT